MKRLSLVIVFMLSIGFALDISALMSSNVANINEGEETSFDLLVTNNEGSPITLKLAITGIPTWIRASTSQLILQSGQTEIITFDFSDKATPTSYLYLLELRNQETDENVWKGNLIIKVSGEPSEEEIESEARFIKMKTQETVNPGDTLIVALEIPISLLPSDVDLMFINSEDVEVSRVTGSLDKIEKSFTLNIPETQSPGNYILRVHLTGKNLSNQTKVLIEEIGKVEIEKSIQTKLLGKEVTYVGKNIGNIFERGNVTEKISLFDRPLLEANPTPEITRSGTDYLLTWEYRLQPGQEVIIGSYSIDYIPYSIILILFVIAIVLIIQKPEAVEVKKIVEQLPGEDSTRFKIKLVVINSSDEPVNEAVLSDLVPRIAQVTKAYIVKPDTSKTRDGTILTWALGRLEPGEERIIAYETVLGFGIVGKLELPKPSVSWKK